MAVWRFASSYIGPTLLALLATGGLLTADEPASTEVSEQLIHSALERAGDNRPEIQRALETAPEAQRDAVRFLIAYMPDRDVRSLTADYILKNVELAYEARAAVPWGKQLPEDIFFNDVLPYASVNEARDDWRGDFLARFLPLVAECQTPGEAAQVLNRDVFKLLDVQYHATKRPKPDQSPLESIEAKFASCSGLSILLIDACRAVAVPARFAGTPRWATKRGNHSWVEVWDDGWQRLVPGGCLARAEGRSAARDLRLELADHGHAVPSRLGPAGAVRPGRQRHGSLHEFRGRAGSQHEPGPRRDRGLGNSRRRAGRKRRRPSCGR
jgi:hypothetical protein